MKIRNIIENISITISSIFDDCIGLIQWLGKKSNKDKLDKIPTSMQRDFNSYPSSINATLIINDERLKEIARDMSSTANKLTEKKPIPA